jgi:hypothetical protein
MLTQHQQETDVGLSTDDVGFRPQGGLVPKIASVSFPSVTPRNLTNRAWNRSGFAKTANIIVKNLSLKGCVPDEHSLETAIIKMLLFVTCCLNHRITI